jgi:hypothetical protein
VPDGLGTPGDLRGALSKSCGVKRGFEFSMLNLDGTRFKQSKMRVVF